MHAIYVAASVHQVVWFVLLEFMLLLDDREQVRLTSNLVYATSRNRSVHNLNKDLHGNEIDFHLKFLGNLYRNAIMLLQIFKINFMLIIKTLSGDSELTY